MERKGVGCVSGVTKKCRIYLLETETDKVGESGRRRNIITSGKGKNVNQKYKTRGRRMRKICQDMFSLPLTKKEPKHKITFTFMESKITVLYVIISHVMKSIINRQLIYRRHLDLVNTICPLFRIPSAPAGRSFIMKYITYPSGKL